MQRPHPGQRQDHQDRLGPVGHRRQGVERQRREALDRGDLLVGGLARGQWPAHEQAPHRRAGDHRALTPVGHGPGAFRTGVDRRCPHGVEAPLPLR